MLLPSDSAVHARVDGRFNARPSAHPRAHSHDRVRSILAARNTTSVPDLSTPHPEKKCISKLTPHTQRPQHKMTNFEGGKSGEKKIEQKGKRRKKEARKRSRPGLGLLEVGVGEKLCALCLPRRHQPAPREHKTHQDVRRRKTRGK
eukprot:1211342-Rhodomonas_salina.1